MSNLRDAQQPTTVTWKDGRVVDAFPSGNVQVYTPDLRHGYEINLPPGWIEGGDLSIIRLG